MFRSDGILDGCRCTFRPYEVLRTYELGQSQNTESFLKLYILHHFEPQVESK